MFSSTTCCDCCTDCSSSYGEETLCPCSECYPYMNEYSANDDNENTYENHSTELYSFNFELNQEQVC